MSSLVFDVNGWTLAEFRAYLRINPLIGLGIGLGFQADIGAGIALGLNPAAPGQIDVVAHQVLLGPHALHRLALAREYRFPQSIDLRMVGPRHADRGDAPPLAPFARIRE